jgi:hypothetical protein
MSIGEISAEQLAELFYLYHEALDHEALDHEALAEPVAGPRAHSAWGEVAQQERKRMIDALRLALLDLGVAAKEPARAKPYFATPGEAEWGC